MTASASLRDFLHRFVSSYDELAVLLLLAGSAERDYSRRELSFALETSLENVDSALAGLVHGDALVGVSPLGGDARYRYRPVDAAVAASVAELQLAYAERRLEVVQMMSANALDRVRSSAARRLAGAYRPESNKKT